ncbi:hypothetical protein [Desulfotomaculum sp. 1211_IL3151]|uniref:hypothetical protein n=1 Tax=Desulfotomaculum sp. 1211_IL3151 TaxID=3084055 RepID=UPI002FDB3E82
MIQNNRVNKITKAFRDEGGNIVNFIINDKTRIKYKDALEKARKGELTGINLYPELVNEITQEQKITGFWKKIQWFIRNQIKS